MSPPSTVTVFSVKPLRAGPESTAPVERSKALAWHGQTMCPSRIWVTGQPWWGQMLEKALNSPSVGWVTTVCAPATMIPPPTGTSAVEATGAPSAAAAASAAARDASRLRVAASDARCPALPHPATRVAATAAPEPVSRVRRAQQPVGSSFTVLTSLRGGLTGVPTPVTVR